MYITSFSSRGVAQPGSASALGAEGPRFESVHPDQNIMNKAKIYSPAKTSMQSARGKSKNWILEFDRENLEKDFIMDWDSSSDTKKQIKIIFESKEDAISYANKKNILYSVIEPNKRKIIIKSYADNFLKN